MWEVIDLTMNDATQNAGVSADNGQGRIILMDGCEFAHTDESALAKLTAVNLISQITIFSPRGLHSKDGEAAIDWMHHIAENACGRAFADMPAVVQNDVVQCAARLVEAINCNPTEIKGNMLPRRSLFCLMSMHDPDFCADCPVHGQFHAAVRNFVESKPGDETKIINKCVQCFKVHPFFIQKRPEKLF